MRCLDSILSLDGTLDSRGRQKRSLFLAMNFAAFVMQATAGYNAWLDPHGAYFYTVAILIVGCVSLAAMAMVLCKINLTTQTILVLACVYTVLAMLIDITARAAGETMWPVLVIIVDFLLVMEVPTCYSTGVVCVAVVYFVVMGVEGMVRFGLLDVPGIMPQEERVAFMTEALRCSDVPCASSILSYDIVAVMVFITDFLATRGFARGLLKEKESMQRTVATVQDIASLLAGYDVEKVAELLEEHGGELPDGMTAALRALEQNLRVYKAYLPQTCLPFELFATEKECVLSGRERSLSIIQSEKSESMSSVCAFGVNCTSVRAQQLGLTSLKGTLLTLNIKDTLHRLEEDSARFSDLFTTVLLKTLQATDSRRGMVDVFVGDRIHCSFNASKQCASHATSALHAATLLIRGGATLYANMGVATGLLFRGDMGCEVMRRFSMVGTLVRDVHGMERAGRMLGCDVLCNRLCFSDAECEHDLRLLPCKVEVAQDCEPEVVAELVTNEQDAVDVADEWMYQIGGKKHWGEYNTVVRGYLRGDKLDVDVVKAWTAAGGVGTPANAVPSGTCFAVVYCYLRQGCGGV